MQGFRKHAAALALVASVFSGSAAAQTEGDQCRIDIGFWTVATTGATGAWAAVSANTTEFKSNKPPVKSCSVPKNKAILITINREMTTDECNLYTGLANADSKVAAHKAGDAYLALSSMVAKVDTLFAQDKLTKKGYDAVRPAVVTAQMCTQALMSN